MYTYTSKRADGCSLHKNIRVCLITVISRFSSATAAAYHCENSRSFSLPGGICARTCWYDVTKPVVTSAFLLQSNSAFINWQFRSTAVPPCAIGRLQRHARQTNNQTIRTCQSVNISKSRSFNCNRVSHRFHGSYPSPPVSACCIPIPILSPQKLTVL